jgi:ABC-type glycerol-3-phosphate transport system substrate-binding protein
MKTTYTLIAVLCTIPLVGFGCRGISRTAQEAIRPVSIEYWVTTEDVSTLQQFANEYQQFRPYVQIAIRQIRADEFADTFVNALADDVAPDIISVPIRELPSYQSRLSAMPSTVQVANVYTTGGLSSETVVEPVINAMPTPQTISRTFIRPVEEQVIIANRVYGLPLAVDTMALFVNRDILDASGVPELPEDWDSFTEAVKESTKFSANGNITQSGVALGTADNIENAFDILSLLWLQNGLPLDTFGVRSIGLQTQRGVPDHPTLQTLRFYTDFAKADRDVYTWNESLSPAIDEFARGRSAFYFGFASDKAVLSARAPQLNYEVIALPQLDPTNPRNVINFSVQAVVAKSPDQDVAWDFVRYITQAQNIERYTAATNLITPLRSQVAVQSENTELVPFLQGLLTATNWYQGRSPEAAERALSSLLRQFVAPYSEDIEPNERDAAIVETFIRTVEQSL